MSSLRRLLSSRNNGRLSRGPCTPEGRQRAAQNALRHGLLAKCIVLPAENEEAFHRLFHEYLERFGPVDGFEFGLLEEMAAAYWRIRRAWAIEKTALAEAAGSQPPGDQATRITAAFRQLASSPEMPLLHRYETRLHLMFQRAFQNLMLLRTLEAPGQAAPDPAVPNEPSPISGHPRRIP